MKLMIGENIRSYRKKNGLTQEEFAERLGVTYQSVSRWENGATYPDLELIPSISELLGVTIDGLLGMPMRERERRASESFDARVHEAELRYKTDIGAAARNTQIPYRQRCRRAPVVRWKHAGIRRPRGFTRGASARRGVSRAASDVRSDHSDDGSPRG